MLDDNKIIKHNLPQADTITIYPVADIHFGSMYCREKEFGQFRDRILREENAYVVLMGDLVNNNLKSSVGSPFEDVVHPAEQKRIMCEMLRPLAEQGRILAAISGDHERRTKKETDQDIIYDIMCKLDIERVYRENIAFVYLCIGRHSRSRNPIQTYSLAMTHGAGGGALTGGTVNRIERFGYTVGADILVTGHTHTGSFTIPKRALFDASRQTIQYRPFCCVQCSSWLDYGGYAMQKMLLPKTTAAESCQKIVLSGKQGKRRIELSWAVQM